MPNQICNDARECFAKDSGRCTILSVTYEKECPFCKPERDITNGTEYPFNPYYGREEENA